MKYLKPLLIIALLTSSTATLLAFTFSRPQAAMVSTDPEKMTVVASPSPSPPAAEMLPPVEYLSQRQLWPSLQSPLVALGDCLEKPGKERLVCSGTLTRAGDAQAVPILLVREFSEQLRLEIQAGAATQTLNFDGRRMGGDYLNQAHADIIEALTYDTADHFFEASMQGIAASVLGSHLRLDDGTTVDYVGPYYEVFQLIEPVKISLATAERQRVVNYYFNSDTLLLERVRYEERRADGTRRNVETLISDWQEVQGQRVPMHVSRLVDGEQVFTLNLTSAQFGARLDDGLFNYSSGN